VGAGLSGLYAAYKLNEQGLSNFKIVEALDRIGGRVQSLEVDKGLSIDLGGQWTCSKQVRIEKLIKEYQFPTIKPVKKGINTYEFLNKKIKKRWKVPPVNILGLYGLWRMTSKYNRLLKQISKEQPWESDLSNTLDLSSLEEWINTTIKNKAGRAYYKMLVQEWACTKLDKVSFLDNLWCIKTTGSFYNNFSAEEKWLKDGAQKIAEKISLTFHDKIILNSPVTEIDYAQDVVRVKTNKETFFTKKVIVTVPLHLTNKIVFNPPLPNERTILIHSLPTSSVIKTIILFKTPFWREKGLSGKYLSNRHSFQLAIDTSDETTPFGILTLFSSGDKAIQLGSLAFEERKKIILDDLESFIGKQAKNPLDYYEKDWTKEEWIKGGYGTHFPTGILSKYGRYLYKNVGPIHWAGSETATEWRLYMEGALQSGERAAQEVINLIKK
jgi:monoamine oxidase